VEIVLGLAEMELVFPTAALIVLCFVLVARKVLITNVLATAERCSHSVEAVSPAFPTQQQAGRWARSWEGT